MGLKWFSSVFVRFWGRSREELDFSLVLQNQISGESGPGISREQRGKSQREGNAKFKFFREIWCKIHISQEDLFKVKVSNRGGGGGVILELFSEAPELSELTCVF